MAIMERHGLGGLLMTNQQFSNGGGEAVTITDAPGHVCFTVTDKSLRLTSDQARYLARCFSEAADRIDAKSATPANET